MYLSPSFLATDALFQHAGISIDCMNEFSPGNTKSKSVSEPLHLIKGPNSEFEMNRYGQWNRDSVLENFLKKIEEKAREKKTKYEKS